VNAVLAGVLALFMFIGHFGLYFRPKTYDQVPQSEDQVMQDGNNPNMPSSHGIEMQN